MTAIVCTHFARHVSSRANTTLSYRIGTSGLVTYAEGIHDAQHSKFCSSGWLSQNDPHEKTHVLLESSAGCNETLLTMMPASSFDDLSDLSLSCGSWITLLQPTVTGTVRGEAAVQKALGIVVAQGATITPCNFDSDSRSRIGRPCCTEQSNFGKVRKCFDPFHALPLWLQFAV